MRGLTGVSKGAAVLDLPCGTGRLLPELARHGYAVTEADSSAHMVELARQFAVQSGLSLSDERFIVASVFDTGFADNEFEAVVCNRLIHHFREPEVRRTALRELSRICHGPIIVSFFCNWAFDATVFHTKQLLRRTKAADRIPIWPGVFAKDARVAGLDVRRWIPTRPGVSKQWYAVLHRPVT